MLINHDITLDIVNPGPTPRIQVKQGDTYSRNIRIAALRRLPTSRREGLNTGTALAMPVPLRPATRSR